MVFIAIANGALREGWYGKHLGELRALIMGLGQNCPETQLISHYQGKMARESYLFKNPWLSVHPLLGCHAQGQQA